MEVQGYVVIALAVVLLGYLLPHLVRSRQLLLDSRAEDRFSADLRVLATAGTVRTGAVGRRRVGPHHRGSLDRPYVHQRRSEAPAVNRPTTRSARAVHDARTLAAARAARAAEISRRAAAARRRLILTVVLLAVTVGAWVVVATTGAGWWLGAVPSAMLLTVLALGRRAAAVARERDAVARTEMAELEQRLKVVGRRTAPRTAGSRAVTAGEYPSRGGRPVEDPASPTAELPGDQRAQADQADQGAPTDPTDEAPDDDEPRAHEAPPEQSDAHGRSSDAGEREPGDDRSDSTATSAWTPVPVPLPTYTLKPTAPRREVDPYRATEGRDEAAVPHRPTEASPPSTPRVTPGSAGLDVEAVLARRRAAGA